MHKKIKKIVSFLDSRFLILNSCRGFTVVELIIAIGLFIALFGIVSGSFINALRTERQIIALAAANDGAQSSMEQMAREIRTGANFDLRFDFRSEGDLIFTNYKGESITYRLTNEGIERGVAGVFKEVTADNVKIKELKFIICDPNDCRTPRVSIALAVAAADPSLSAIVSYMQTTVSARF